MNSCIACSSTLFFRKMYDFHDQIVSDVPEENNQLLISKVPKHFIFKGFVCVCKQCGHGSMETIPNAESIDKFYKLKFWQKASLEHRPKTASSGEQSPKHLARARRQQEFISSYLDLKQLRNCLEISPGEALLTLTLKQKSSETTRFDLCEPGDSWDHYYKFQQLNKVAEFFPFPSTIKYQLIVASHWLEHIADPKLAFSQLYQQLDEYGYLMLEVPNTAHSYWSLSIQDAPHIHFFTLDSLVRLAVAAGFKCIDASEFGITIDEHMRGAIPDYQLSGPREGGYSIVAFFQKLP
jgi:hypothetical protein